MTWEQSEEEDFTEYKIYSHTTSVFDENTATLLHETTNIQDTTFEYVMPSSITLYFRVLVMNEFGKLGGSQILGLTSVSYNHFPYGAFEDTDKFFESWLTLGFISIQDSIVKEGNNALLLQSMIDVENVQWTSNILEPPQFYVEKNQAYELSFWYKASGLAQIEAGPINFHYTQENQTFLQTTIGSSWPGQWIPQTPFKTLNGVDWSKYTEVFYPTSDSTVQFHFEGNVDELYFDSMRLIKVIEEDGY